MEAGACLRGDVVCGDLLAAMGARVAEVEIAVGHAGEKFDDEGNLVDENVRTELEDAISTLFAEIDPVLVAA